MTGRTAADRAGRKQGRQLSKGRGLEIALGEDVGLLSELPAKMVGPNGLDHHSYSNTPPIFQIAY